MCTQYTVTFLQRFSCEHMYTKIHQNAFLSSAFMLCFYVQLCFYVCCAFSDIPSAKLTSTRLSPVPESWLVLVACVGDESLEVRVLEHKATTTCFTTTASIIWEFHLCQEIKLKQKHTNKTYETYPSKQTNQETWNIERHENRPDRDQQVWSKSQLIK